MTAANSKSNSPFREELNFPVECHYKVVMTHSDTAEEKLRQSLKRQGVNKVPARGNQSAGGKYVTYNISVMIDSKEMMDTLDAAIRATEGVKFVL